jgi:hypothetical protein
MRGEWYYPRKRDEINVVKRDEWDEMERCEVGWDVLMMRSMEKAADFWDVRFFSEIDIVKIVEWCEWASWQIYWENPPIPNV